MKKALIIILVWILFIWTWYLAIKWKKTLILEWWKLSLSSWNSYNSSTNKKSSDSDMQWEWSFEESAKLELSEVVASWNIDFCKKLDAEQAKRCIYVISMRNSDKSRDPKDCSAISSEDLKKQCLEKIYANVTLYASSLKDCDIITDNEAKKQCVTKYKMSSSEWISDISACSTWDSVADQECKDNFHLNQVMKWKSLDMANCEKITFEDMKKQCITYYNAYSKASAIKAEADKAKASWDVIWAAKKMCEMILAWCLLF